MMNVYRHDDDPYHHHRYSHRYYDSSSLFSSSSSQSSVRQFLAAAALKCALPTIIEYTNDLVTRLFDTTRDEVDMPALSFWR